MSKKGAKMVVDRVIRLRLSGARTSLQVQDNPIIKASAGEVETSAHAVVYHDTPDLQLRRKGILLTISKEGKGWVQRLSRGSPGVPRGGTEAEKVLSLVKLASGDLNLKKLKSTGAAKQALGRVSGVLLRPVMTIGFSRSRWRLSFPDGARIALEEEQGDIAYGSDRQSYHEVSLTLLEGDLNRLHQTALAMTYHLMPEFSCASAADCGYLHLDPSLAKPLYGNTLTLQAGMSAEKVFSLINRAMWRLIVENQCSALHGSEGVRFESLNELLLALKRLRVVVALYDYLMPVAIRGELDEELKWLIGEMLPAGEWDELMGGTLEPFIHQFPSYQLDFLREAAVNRRRESYQRMEQALRSFRFTRLALGLANWLSGQGWRDLTDMPQKRQMARTIPLLARGMLERHYRLIRPLVDRSPKSSLPQFADLSHEARRQLIVECEILEEASWFFADLFRNRQSQTFQGALEWLYSGIKALESIRTAHRLFATILPEKAPGEEASVWHLLNGWLGAREESYQWDTAEAWKAFADCPVYWQN